MSRTVSVSATLGERATLRRAAGIDNTSNSTWLARRIALAIVGKQGPIAADIRELQTRAIPAKERPTRVSTILDDATHSKLVTSAHELRVSVHDYVQALAVIHAERELARAGGSIVLLSSDALPSEVTTELLALRAVFDRVRDAEDIHANEASNRVRAKTIQRGTITGQEAHRATREIARLGDTWRGHLWTLAGWLRVDPVTVLRACEVRAREQEDKGRPAHVGPQVIHGEILEPEVQPVKPPTRVTITVAIPAPAPPPGSDLLRTIDFDALSIDPPKAQQPPQATALPFDIDDDDFLPPLFLRREKTS